MRKTKLENNEFYHIYNRGTDKRQVILDKFDSDRLVQSLLVFNTAPPVGSMFKANRNQNSSSPVTPILAPQPLVEIVAYCFNPNHFHLLVKQVEDNGVSKFMQKFGTGFTRYFNEKYERNWVLFQGKFKARHITNNEDLLRMSAYVNLNNRVHSLNGKATTLVRSSWDEYKEVCKENICAKDIVIEQFASIKEYMKFAEYVVKEIAKERKIADTSDLKEVKKEFYAHHFD